MRRSHAGRIWALFVVLGMLSSACTACDKKVRVKFKVRVKDSGTVTSSITP